MTLRDVRTIVGRDAEAALRGADFAVVPLGSVEWHGPHLPLGTDTLIAEDLATALDEGPWTGVLYPTVALTAAPGQTRHYPGTVGLRPDTMVQYLSQVLAALADSGLRRVLLVNAHDANMATARSAMEWVSGHRGVSMLLASWFQLVPPAETAEIFGPGQVRGHGGAFETSGVLAVAPDAVALDGVGDIPPRPRLAAADHVLVEPHPEPWQGWSGLVSRVTPESADRVRRAARARLTELVAQWLDTPPPQLPGRRP
jgi:creatinine amidohydrolase